MGLLFCVDINQFCSGAQLTEGPPSGRAKPPPLPSHPIPSHPIPSTRLREEPAGEQWGNIYTCMKNNELAGGPATENKI